MKVFILILTGVALSFPVMAENPMNLGKALKARSLFKVADSNQDGKVSYAEHEAFIAMQVEKGRDRFKIMDLNSDGYITKDEAKEARKKFREAMKDKRYENLDSNSDGSVSKEELGEARAGLKDKIKAFMR